jgi:hypothetical protein
MTVEDYHTFVAMGKAMAARNGYKPQQSSDLYITDGDQIDWMYGVHRIFSFTWELYPPETSSVWGDHYPPDEKIAPETNRNRTALLYLIDVGGCPYRAIGLTRTHCGPFFDDLEGNQGWVHNPYGTDTATNGTWAPRNPEPTWFNGAPMQLEATYSGAKALVTGGWAGTTASANDLDGGTTTVASAPIALPAAPGSLSFRYYFAHGPNSGFDDSFHVFVEVDGTLVRVFRERGYGRTDPAAWQLASVPLSSFGGKTIRIVFQATDGGPESLIEAGIDNVRIERPA